MNRGPSVLCVATVALLSLASCRTPRGVAGTTLGKDEKPGEYLKGKVVDLSKRAILDRRDFVWAIDLTSAPAAAAFSHMASKNYRLGLWELEGEKPALDSDPTLNLTEFDVEGVAFSRDGAKVAVVSRDKSVKVFSRKGVLLASTKTEEKLVSVAISPDGKFVLTGSENGLVTALSADTLGFLTDARVHRDEVRALAFDDSGILYSASWDRSVLPLELQYQELAATEVRVHFERVGPFAVVHGSVNGKAPATLAYDARLPLFTLTSSAATAAGIDVPLLPDTTTVQTTIGPQVVKLAKNQTVIFKALHADNVEIAICDACVPQGVDGALGQAFLERFDVAFDASAQEARIALKDKTQAKTASQLTLLPGKRLEFPEAVNDLTVDRAGTRLGLALGDKSQRTLEIYNREKAGEIEPVKPENAGAIVDAKTGKILSSFVKHHGVVQTAAISPDGKTLVTGGWDKKLYVFSEGSEQPVYEEDYGWLLRKARFSPDGRLLGVGAWTPQVGRADAESEPSAVIYDVRYEGPASR